MTASVDHEAGVCFGSVTVPLAYVEVLPLETSHDGDLLPSLAAASVKQELLRSTLRAAVSINGKDGLVIHWEEVDDESKLAKDSNPKWAVSSGKLFLKEPWGDTKFKHFINTTSGDADVDAIASEVGAPILHMQQDTPTLPRSWPCLCTGFAFRINASVPWSRARVTQATLIRILPMQQLRSPRLQVSLWKDRLTGECQEPPLSPALVAEVMANQNPETVRELTLRMQMLVSKPVLIGTTADALLQHHRQRQRRRTLKTALQAHVDVFSTKQDEVKAGKSASDMNMFREGTLIVHSPQHGAGKTLLVQAIAQQQLQSSAVYIIRPGALIAKYGIRADVALETILHQIAVRAALAQEPVCIVLDHLDAIMPPAFSGKRSSGDATGPVLNAIVSILKNLTQSLQQRLEFPFPSNNLLYNLNGRDGCALPVRLCLVAVVTCPDDGWRSVRGANNAGVGSMCIFDSLVTGRYRLPALTASTRLSAIQSALCTQGLELSPELEKRLPFLAASAVWAKGRVFGRLAKQVRATHDGAVLVGLGTVASAIASIGKATSTGSDVRFLAVDTDNAGNDLFSTVGGNEEAKMALEDALALDRSRQTMLRSFDLSPPSGILLYGPPGTGKTLLAKAVARLLRSQNAQSSIGGAFVSLSSSDIVRAEVGSGEKMVALAFETARKNAPSVVFIDEFQALFTERTSSGSGRLSSTLLQCMDDVKRWRDADADGNADSSGSYGPADQESRVVVLAATNTPWMIDKAFVRPGRFDRLVHVGLPSRMERESILRLHMGRMKWDSTQGVSELDQVCGRVASSTQGFSGADLAALCRAAAVRCLVEGGQYVEEVHFVGAQSGGLSASSSPALVERINHWTP